MSLVSTLRSGFLEAEADAAGELAKSFDVTDESALRDVRRILGDFEQLQLIVAEAETGPA